jgi:hypothetical protein
VQVARAEHSGIHGFGQADAAMRQQAEAVLGMAYPNGSGTVLVIANCRSVGEEDSAAQQGAMLESCG